MHKLIILIGLISVAAHTYPYLSKSKSLTLIVCLYLLLGVIVSSIVDYSLRNLIKEKVEYTNWDRLTVILLWPTIVLGSIFRKK